MTAPTLPMTADLSLLLRAREATTAYLTALLKVRAEPIGRLPQNRRRLTEAEGEFQRALLMFSTQAPAPATEAAFAPAPGDTEAEQVQHYLLLKDEVMHESDPEARQAIVAVRWSLLDTLIPHFPAVRTHLKVSVTAEEAAAQLAALRTTGALTDTGLDTPPDVLPAEEETDAATVQPQGEAPSGEPAQDTNAPESPGARPVPEPLLSAPVPMQDAQAKSGKEQAGGPKDHEGTD